MAQTAWLSKKLSSGHIGGSTLAMNLMKTVLASIVVTLLKGYD